MKLVIVVNDLGGAHGWSTYALNIVREAVRSGHEVHVFVHEKVSIPIDGVTQHEILPPPHDISWNPYTIIGVSRVVKSRLNSLSPDAVHVIVEPYIQLWSFMSAEEYRLILTLHGTYARLPLTVPGGVRRTLGQLFYTRALKQVGVVIAVSERTKSIFTAYMKGRYEGQTQVIHNAIMLPSGVLKHKVGNINHYTLITVGAVKRRKGIHETIRIFSEWAIQRKKKITYHVVGPIEESSFYVKEVRQLAEAHASAYFDVIFHGRLGEEEKAKLLIESDLYVHLERILPSGGDVEGFGISIIEAASYGVPALVAKGSATVEAVDEGRSGYSIDIEQESVIGEVIDHLLVDRTISPETTYAWAEIHASDRIFEKIEALYAVPRVDDV